MQLRLIPKTELRVSTVCLGTMTFGIPVPAIEAVKLVHTALDQGINFFDTADMYEGYNRRIGSPGGVGETILGDALYDRRERAIVTTKVGSDVGDKGLGRTHILRQIDASLRRLRTTYVDIYEMHRPDSETALSESIAVMADLISVGKIRYWGFSNFSAAQIKEMIDLCDGQGWPRPVVSQPSYSWLDREIEANHLPLCRAFGIAVTPYKPLQGGLLTGKYKRGQAMPANSRAVEHPMWLQLDESLFDRLEQFELEAAAAELAPAQYAVKWLLKQPGVTSIVVGVKNTEQVDAVINTVRTAKEHPTS